MKTSAKDLAARRAEFIRETIAFTARRLEMTGDTHLNACAVAVSMLVSMRSLADQKPLTKADVQAVIDTFMDAAGITTEMTKMGAEIFVHKKVEQSS